MNLRKAALVIFLCTTAFTAVGNAKSSSQNNQVQLASKRSPASFVVRVLTLGHKGR